MSDLPKTTKIHDLPKVSEVNDSDIFIIQSDENTNKIDGADLKAVMQQQALEATFDHTSNNEIHVTKAEKELWNGMSGGGSDFFVTKEELEEALDGIFDGTQQVGDSAKLGGKDASEYVLVKGTSLSTSILDYALTLPIGEHFIRFSGDSYNGNDLPSSNYKYGTANINKRGANAIEVILWGTTSADSRKMAFNFYNGSSWTGWDVYISKADKPTGTYTGNGDATERQIKTGGIGSMVLITNSQNSDFAILCTMGYIGVKSSSFDNNTGAFLSDVDANCKILIRTTNSLFNASGVTYRWKVI